MIDMLNGDEINGCSMSYAKILDFSNKTDAQVAAVRLVRGYRDIDKIWHPDTITGRQSSKLVQFNNRQKTPVPDGTDPNDLIGGMLPSDRHYDIFVKDLADTDDITIGYIEEKLIECGLIPGVRVV